MANLPNLTKRIDKKTKALLASMPKLPRTPQLASNFPVSLPKMELPNLKLPPNPIIENVHENLASVFHGRLAKSIADFDDSLDNDHEVGIRLVSFGQAFTFYLEEMGYWNPSLMLFKGRTEDGDPVKLIQHVHPISILLMTLPREDPTKPKRPIGFAAECVADEDVVAPPT